MAQTVDWRGNKLVLRFVRFLLEHLIFFLNCASNFEKYLTLSISGTVTVKRGLN